MTTTTTMNISQNLMSGKCDEKCSYSFNYQTSSNCNAKNYGNYLQLTYDKQNTPSVLFNVIDYYADNVQIYSPSFHKFNNIIVDAEIVIVHYSLRNGSPLLVCIPVYSSANTSNNSVLFNSIINAAVAYPLKPDTDMISIKLDNYNLNNIVPKKPYFYYTSNNANVIVYGIENSIYAETTIISKLRNIISNKTNVNIPLSDTIYYNQIGSNLSLSGDGEIYIDCKPVGVSDHTEDVIVSKKSSSTETTSETSDLFNYVILFIVVISTISIIHYVLNNLINRHSIMRVT
jgi:hypothetical protein